MVLREPALMERIGSLRQEQFSSELLGRTYGQLRQRYGMGLELSLAGLSDLTGEEMSHIAGILHRQQGPVSEAALQDCVRTITSAHQSSSVQTEEDLLALRNKMKERKGIR